MMLRYINKKNIATFFLVLMCTQYILLEGYTISYIKFAAMCVTPIIWLVASPKISKAFLWAGLYFITILFSGLFNIQSFRFSTVGYLLSFIFMFIMYYNLIYCEKVFSFDYFLGLLKKLILAYTICLLMQQAVHFVGIERFPLINTYSSYGRGFLAGNSLAIEPSQSARILTVAFISLLRMYEVKWGKENVKIAAIYKDAKWVLLGFLWSMLTMGSGTAFVGLAVLSLYFIKRQYVFTVVPALVILYFAIPYINFEPLQRAKVTLEATMTMDADNVREADHSASARVAPIINSITKFDITDSEVWFGKGIDVGVSLKEEKTLYDDYGFLAYILSLVFVFSCCIRFGGLETIMFFIGIGGGTGNIAYFWGILIIFTTVRYFSENKYKFKNYDFS